MYHRTFQAITPLVSATTRATRKYANLAANYRAAMLLDDGTNSESDFHRATAVTATGSARVISGRADLFQFKSEEVLVCDAIDPTMTFVAPLAAGVVERRGGCSSTGRSSRGSTAYSA
jgi:phosphoenolpyruvate synthase/pyruvate phosphate dikinase